MNSDELSVLLNEFDKETTIQINGIRSNAESTVIQMKVALEMTLCSIPDSVRKMPLHKLIKEYGGSIENAALALAPVPSTPKKKNTPKKGKSGIQTQSFQNASLTDLLAQKGKMESQNARKTPTRGRLPPKIPTPNRPKTPTKILPSPRRIVL